MPQEDARHPRLRSGSLAYPWGSGAWGAVTVPKARSRRRSSSRRDVHRAVCGRADRSGVTLQVTIKSSRRRHDHRREDDGRSRSRSSTVDFPIVLRSRRSRLGVHQRAGAAAPRRGGARRLQSANVENISGATDTSDLLQAVAPGGDPRRPRSSLLASVAELPGIRRVEHDHGHADRRRRARRRRGERAARPSVFDWFREVDARFSTYKADSEISRLNRDEIALGRAVSVDVRWGDRPLPRAP